MSVIEIAPKAIEHKNIIWSPPGDKSISQRTTILSSLANGPCKVRGLLWSEDTVNNMRILNELGVKFTIIDQDEIVIHGRGLNGFKDVPEVINVGNSATSARLFLSTLTGQQRAFIIDGNPVLRSRSMKWVVTPLQEMGANISYIGEDGFLPLKVEKSKLIGKTHVAQVSSAQFVSALLYAGLYASNGVEIIRKVKARDHTERLFNHFGISICEKGNVVKVVEPKNIEPKNVIVPGDFSSAAMALTLVVINKNPGITMRINSVGLNPTRIGFLKVIEQMGANIRIENTKNNCGEPLGDIIVKSGSQLRGIKISGDEFVQSLIDEIPLICVMAAFAEGETEIRNIEELRDKDTNRGETIAKLLDQVGIKTLLAKDRITVFPGPLKSLPSIDVPKDHRITMAAMALASQFSKKTTIKGWEVTRVSFPSIINLLDIFIQVKCNQPFFQWGPHLINKEGISK
ncbi:3-phosphoshikimate 1-carboxyvinyltransferase [Priestia aryabhattai]|uniref:3-phosphoshikimate 1-carboxyvinyltransferase n=1 Tax=Priestia aryabhattai TaxID=412384 RepID=UPI00398219BD